MLILLTNDDGIYAEGIKELEKALKRVADVLVFAPDREQSASSHSLTLERPLRIHQRDKNHYACDGTPTDCVLLAVHGILKHEKPDLVISGINHGSNMGEDVTYSGTVAAAIEGSNLGIPSLAISNTDPGNFDSFRPAARFISKLIRQFDKLNLGSEVFYNINFPTLNESKFKDFKITKLGRREYKDIIIENTDPRGKHYYWIGGHSTWEDINGSDFKAISEGFVSISPLKMNFTDLPSIERLSAIKLRF